MSLEFSAMRLSACRRAPWLSLGFVLVVTAALAGPHGAAAQAGNSPSSTASEPTATTTPVGPARKAGSEPGSTEDCPPLQPASFEGITSAVVIELDSSTLWRPRGSEVRVIVSGSPQLSVLALRACFGWSADDRASPGFQAGSEIWKQRSSPLVRSVSSAAGKIEYGVAVPDMPQIQGAWPLRALGHSPHRFTGLFTVPVADMQVIATVRGPDGKDMQLSIVLPVGITSASSAVVLVLASLAVALFALNRMISGPTVLPKSGVLLKLISTNDGRASLSQFQIVLWTCVVAGSAIYVMALSGSLIAITSGTLVLLGIAGAAGLLARVPPTAPNPVTANPTAPAPLPPPPPPLSRPPPRAPRWSDMVIVDTGGLSQIDVTRVQMLIFTIISAAFVGIKVATSYEIPDIPEGFLILMGISNGVYLTGRRLAAQ